MCCDIRKGTDNDAKYLDVMREHIEPNEAWRGWGRSNSRSSLKEIHDRKAFFITKLKSDTRIYIKNPNPDRYANGNIKKSTNYIKIDIQEIIKPLVEGETIELKDIYLGQKKDLKTRLIITKLTEDNKKKDSLDIWKKFKKVVEH